ncbi:putative regulator of phenylacetic acid degradation, ArsR family protein [Rhizobium freirei PRF 81]|uniref:Putative regulator of phenylacetic acid degradation, ArsR family protein n=1 Tax=Rhizobium freirei PRF 81 TaxID=363754 RepID=N6UEL4_9HYPH|nr:PaaX family transcriptional regulator C-terminal domain-containing protein [Rhizobium freirei]ENN88598.1 putative regulator of phenylacetic acid degradation, ArsR family protein [Rhizobium freirei PRF 81]
MTVEAAKEGIRELVKRIVVERPPTAASFIVTIYGDIVEPRGGVVWIGNLIETCAGVGISETLVRTAVSRLVSSGQLLGEREGRRSYYRLSPAARTEFSAAAEVLFRHEQAEDWQFVRLAGVNVEEEMQALERAGMARLGPRLAVGPRRPLPGAVPALVFRADVAEGELAAFVADQWDLAPHAEAYRAFLSRFTPFAETLAVGPPADAETALSARLLLVHQFRAIALRDPRLPAAALPADWPGNAARRLFAELYLALSPAAGRHVARQFVTASGPLAEESDETRRRAEMLGLRASI